MYQFQLKIHTFEVKLPIDSKVYDLVWDETFRKFIMSSSYAKKECWKEFMSENVHLKDIIIEATEIVLGLRVEEPDITNDEIQRLISSTKSKFK